MIKLKDIKKGVGLNSFEEFYIWALNLSRFEKINGILESMSKKQLIEFYNFISNYEEDENIKYLKNIIKNGI